MMTRVYFALLVVMMTTTRLFLPGISGSDMQNGLTSTTLEDVEQHEIKTLSKNGMKDVKKLVERLNLTSRFGHEEGLTQLVWTSKRSVVAVTEPSICGMRPAGNSGYFLLQRGEIDDWNRFKEDVIFFWLAGGKLKVHSIDTAGNLVTRLLGNTLIHEDSFFEVANDHWNWIALEPTKDSEYVLFGVVAFPAFKFSEDYEAGKKDELLKEYPQHREIIERLSFP